MPDGLSSGSAVRTPGEHAVVLGAGIGGLLAARALTDAYQRVTVIERDPLPVTSESRRGVPQGRHVHALLPGGSRILEELFPGLLDELRAAGAPVVTSFAEVRVSLGGHPLSRTAGQVPGTIIQPSRPCIEGHLRARVRALPRVTIVDRCEGTALVPGRTGDGVEGVRVRALPDGREAALRADLVVDATGRTSRSTAWLPQLGYEAPPEDELRVDVRYVSRILRLSKGALGDTKEVIIGARPGRPRGLGMFAVEGDRWLLSLFGYAGHHPPTDPEGFLAFLDTVAPPDVAAVVRDAEPLTDLATHRFPSGLRRRYASLRRFPHGLIVLGDAVCSVNPVYGQGMTIAAMQAVALRDALRDGPDALARRFFRAATRPVDVVWNLSTGADLTLPEVSGPRPLRTRAANAYLERVLSAAEHDDVVTQRFFRAIGLLAPPSLLFQPSTVRRVLAARR